MALNLEELIEGAGKGAESLSGLFSQAAGAASLTSLFEPVDPFNRSPLFTPVVAAMGVAGLVVAAGVALGALAAALAALAALYFLLSDVFGYELTLAVPIKV